MKQVLQNLKDGSTMLEDVPAPKPGAGHVLVQTSRSLVSAGTERMLVEFGKGNLISKARQQPDKVKQVLEKVRTDGIGPTLEAVLSKLDQPLPLGYCNVGRIVEIGRDTAGYSLGGRVVSNGQHAEYVRVPKNLTARIPDNVSDDAASFTVLGAIGLQGIRLANPTLGECVVVIGLGLIGLLTVQMLRAQGCRVLGIDFDPARLALAERFGAEIVNPGARGDPLAAANAFSRGAGVDAVIITASSKSNDPVSQAAKMCRQRGRIVLVGVVGLELSRADFYEKELTFQVSCSYGPGRYDPAYEEGGNDYPIGFVRWTEQRNFEAVLDLMSTGALDVEPLISHRFSLADVGDAYAVLASGSSSLGILLEYASTVEKTFEAPVRRVTLSSRPELDGAINVAFLGAGNYAGRVLIPAFKAGGANLKTVVSGSGVTAAHFGKKYGFADACSDELQIYDDPSINTVVIATRHDIHARQVLASLRAGKHVFCEKPLCLTLEELSEIEQEALSRPSQMLMVGFNRRFAPQVQKMKALLGQTDEPKSFIMTVNAGEIPADHWTQDQGIGGGRIIGEACHFVDLLRYLAGAEVISHRALALGPHPSIDIRGDKVTILLQFADGSTGTIHYLANGNKGFSKERLEVFVAGKILQLDNFRKMRGWGWSGFRRMNLLQQDKGQSACVAAVLDALKKGTPAPIAVGEVFESNRVSIEIAQALHA